MMRLRRQEIGNDRADISTTSTIGLYMLPSADPSIQAMPSFPSKILVIVSELLLGENDLSAVGRLIVSCSSIYQATQSTLYDSVHFRSSRAAERAILLKGPDSWQYVK